MLKKCKAVFIFVIVFIFIISVTVFAQYEVDKKAKDEDAEFQWPKGIKAAVSLSFDDARLRLILVFLYWINMMLKPHFMFRYPVWKNVWKNGRKRQPTDMRLGTIRSSMRARGILISRVREPLRIIHSIKWSLK